MGEGDRGGGGRRSRVDGQPSLFLVVVVVAFLPLLPLLLVVLRRSQDAVKDVAGKTWRELENVKNIWDELLYSRSFFSSHHCAGRELCVPLP